MYPTLVPTRTAIYPEWTHKHGCLPRMLKLARLQDRIPAVAELYRFLLCTMVLPMRVEGATNQLDLPSLTPLYVAGFGRLQLGVRHWATSVITASN